MTSKLWMLAVLVLAVVPARAQDGRYAWEEFGNRVKASGKVQPLGPDLFGDQVSLSNGALSFSVTDVSIPGNNSLPVAFSRSFAVSNRKDYRNDATLADWNLEVPHISGVFASDWLGSTAGNPGKRCSVTSASAARPPTPGHEFTVEDIWQGNSLSIPGVGGGEMLLTDAATAKPTTGGPYYWYVAGHIHVACLPDIQNGTGEGFIATTPDGTRYWFDWMAQYWEPPLKVGGSTIAQRHKNVLYATRVEDRFGNRVDYTYTNAWNAPARLTSIAGAGNDSRALTLQYNPSGHVSTVSDGSRTWQYQYGDAGDGQRTLSAVVLPDTSRWNIDFAALSRAEIRYPIGNAAEPTRNCFMNATPFAPLEYAGTVTHPSGATGEFRVDIRTHGRSSVPVSCSNFTTGLPPAGNDMNDDVNQWVGFYEAFSLKSKTITGPGLPTTQWTYSYTPNNSFFFYPGSSAANPVCPVGTDCSAPPCTSESCAKSSETLVTGPDGEWARHYYGNTYRYNEGKLLKTETGQASTLLRTVTTAYDLSQAPAAYPAKYGTSAREKGDGFPAEYHRPQIASATAESGTTFTRSVNDFDYFARPLSVTRASSLGHTRTDVTAYHDNLSQWVLGQTLSVTNTNTSPNVVLSRAEYDGVTALPLRYYGPGTVGTSGKLVQTLTYNADGTVATAKDGNNRTTTLSSWYRGIPRSITYADTRTQSAVVNPSGWVTQVTDENGFATNYTYDAMGRLASVAYPTGDSTAWATETFAFTPVQSDEHGLSPGHWTMRRRLGNRHVNTYYDALWRPVLEESLDVADVASTLSQVVKQYDAQGRLSFQSYPQRGVGNYWDVTQGTWTEYDALGRVTSVSQDSEHGLLTTLTEYLPGNQTRVTNPRNQVTLTGYQVFDQPSYDAPVWVQHPENARTDIARDAFGKPTALTRRDAGNTQLVTRSYSYDGYQQLCKAVEPETGATLMGYDGAGNLAWSSAGLATGTACEPNGTATAVADRKVSRTYDARNRLTALGFPDGKGNQVWDYTVDGLPATVTTNNSNGGQAVVNSYSYNKRRLLTSESISQPGYSWSLGYQYDGNGALAHLTYPSGLQVAFAPNALGQPTQAGPYATGVSYYPNGAIQQFTYGNGLVHSMTQNARQLPLRVQSGNATGYEYAYDRNGNPAQIHDLVRGTNYSRTLQYDGLDRLTAAGSVSFGGDHWHRFTYDAVDNLTSWKLAGVKDYANYYYEPNTNRLLSIQNSANAAIVGLWYDEQGNLSNKNGQQYAFDYGNRLREAANQETYRYDGHGRRVQASTPAQAHILSMYGQDGTLRRQEDHRTGKHYEYVTLAGSLVAKVTTVVAPGTPSLTTPGYSGNGSYTVSWTATPTATSYELQEAVNGGSWAAAYSGTATSQAYTGKGSGSYGYRVRACQASSCSGWSATGTTTVELPPASAPGLSVPASAPNGTYTVSWTAVGGATTYTLEESANGGSWASVQNTASQSKAYSGQAAGSYSYRVKACNPAGCGPTSAAATTQTLYPPAAAPSLTVPTSSYTGSYTVSWTAVTGATTYQLEEQVGSGSWSLVHNAAGSSKAISGKGAGSYSYRVKACNTVGCGPLTAVQTVQVTLPPTAAPTVTAPASSYTGSYTVSWTGVAVATRYELEERVNGGSWTQVHNAADTSKAISGKGAATYEYRARACNVAGCAAYSAVVATQVIPPPAGAPTLTVPTSSNTGGYTVSWTTVATATAYQLEERVNGGAWAQIHNAAATSKLLTGKPPGTYEYRVQACNAAGCGGYSVTKAIALTTPATPAGLFVQQTSYSCDTGWGDSAGASSYELRSFNGTVYTGPNTWFSQMSPRTCLAWYEVRACSGVGCSSWSAPVSAPGDVDPLQVVAPQGVGE